MLQNKRVTQSNSGRRFQKVKRLKERLNQRERERETEGDGAVGWNWRRKPERGEKNERRARRRGNFKMAKRKRYEERGVRTQSEWKEREQRAWDITSEMIHFLRAWLQKRPAGAELNGSEESRRVPLLTLLTGRPARQRHRHLWAISPGQASEQTLRGC